MFSSCTHQRLLLEYKGLLTVLLNMCISNSNTVQVIYVVIVCPPEH